MNASVERILAFGECIAGFSEPEPLIDQFQILVQSLGFAQFIISGLPWEGFDFRHLMAGSNVPEDWLEVYVDNDYLRDDAIARAALVNTAPFTWQAAKRKFAISARALEIAEGWEAHGCRDGITFPFLDPHNRMAVASIMTDRKVAIAPHLVIILQGIMPMVYDRFWQLEAGKREQLAQLSGREVEVLKLVSGGKRLHEIAAILNVSFSTVRHHLRSASEKLGGTSLPHTVAAAIFSRQI